jgi:hypothetical protein
VDLEPRLGHALKFPPNIQMPPLNFFDQWQRAAFECGAAIDICGQDGCAHKIDFVDIFDQNMPSN